MRPLLFPLLAAVAFAAENPSPPGFVVQPGTGMAPEETARTMKVPDGFAVNLFAGEPDLHQPIAFTLDDRGRLWVVENYSYPDWKPEGHDRILILEDTDGDGHFDKSTVFYDKLNMASAIEIGFGGVWVGSCPHLLFIPDRNRDDVPDGPPEVVLDGWEHQDMHEFLNSFNWGPDGWLYGTQGVFTSSKVGKAGAPDSERTPLNACVWRLQPETRKFEVFAHGTSNPWGVDFNDYGQAFITACVIPHLYHMIQGGLYQRQSGAHFNANAYDDIKTIALHRHWGTSGWAGSRAATADTDAAGGGHAHCGCLVYLGDQWPAGYRGTVLMNNIHGNRMNNDSLTAQGSGWVGDRRPDFMKSQDKWYRGLGIRQGPDGSVYVLDWYDARACHQQRPHDRTNGRIYKIVYGQPKPWSGDVAAMKDDELVKLQSSKNEWLVRHARRVLQERGSNPSVQQLLQAQLSDSTLDTPQRLRSLWALKASGGIDRESAGRLLKDKDAHVRAWTIQLFCETDGTPLAQTFAALAQSDPSPIVRLYLASACQRLPMEARAPIVAALLQHGEDSDDHNLPLMYWYAAEPLVAAQPSAAADLLAKCQLGRIQEFIARRLTSLAQ